MPSPLGSRDNSPTRRDTRESHDNLTGQRPQTGITDFERHTRQLAERQQREQSDQQDNSSESSERRLEQNSDRQSVNRIRNQRHNWQRAGRHDLIEALDALETNEEREAFIQENSRRRSEQGSDRQRVNARRLSEIRLRRRDGIPLTEQETRILLSLDARNSRLSETGRDVEQISQAEQSLETTEELQGLLNRCYSNGYQGLSSWEQNIMNNAVDVCDEINAEIKAENIDSSLKEQKEEMMSNIILGGNRTEYRRRVTDEERSSSIYQDLEDNFYSRWKAKNRENNTNS
jgi:hypothetical protein